MALQGKRIADIEGASSEGLHAKKQKVAGHCLCQLCGKTSKVCNKGTPNVWKLHMHEQDGDFLLSCKSLQEMGLARTLRYHPE
eukprot:6490942-Amphidinium_carterae.2